MEMADFVRIRLNLLERENTDPVSFAKEFRWNFVHIATAVILEQFRRVVALLPQPREHHANFQVTTGGDACLP